MPLMLLFAIFAFAPRPGQLPPWAMKPAVALGPVIDCGRTSEWIHYGPGWVIRVQRERQITIQSVGNQGSSWRVQASYPGDGGCRFLKHDLDRNGYADLIVLTANGGSGPAGLTATILAFDGSGRPVPWQATAAFVVEGEQLRNFVDFDGDGRVELLVPHAEEHGLQRDWAVRFSLYTISSGYLTRTVGSFAGRKFPVDEPPGVQLTDEPDLTNAVPGSAAGEVIKRSRGEQGESCWLRGISLRDGGIVLPVDSAVPAECGGYLALQEGGRLSMPLIVVADFPEGRLIDINHAPQEALGRIIQAEMRVAFAGRSCEAGCGPLIMWARPRSGSLGR